MSNIQTATLAVQTPRNSPRPGNLPPTPTSCREATHPNPTCVQLGDLITETPEQRSPVADLSLPPRRRRHQSSQHRRSPIQTQPDTARRGAESVAELSCRWSRHQPLCTGHFPPKPPNRLQSRPQHHQHHQRRSGPHPGQVSSTPPPVHAGGRPVTFVTRAGHPRSPSVPSTDTRRLVHMPSIQKLRTCAPDTARASAERTAISARRI